MLCIAEQVRSARKKVGMTQVQLAKAAGISRSYLAGVEGGNYNPSLKVLVSIAGVCHVDLNFLAGMTEIHGSGGGDPSQQEQDTA